MWKSCSVDAVLAGGFALTGGCKVVRASLLCRKSSVALLAIGERSEHTPHGKPAHQRNKGQRVFSRSHVAKTIFHTLNIFYSFFNIFNIFLFVLALSIMYKLYYIIFVASSQKKQKNQLVPET